MRLWYCFPLRIIRIPIMRMDALYMDLYLSIVHIIIIFYYVVLIINRNSVSVCVLCFCKQHNSDATHKKQAVSLSLSMPAHVKAMADGMYVCMYVCMER